DLVTLVDQLLLVGEALPGRPRAGLAFVQAAVGDALGASAPQLDGAGLGKATLRFGDLGPHQIARQATGDEDHVALNARDSPPAEGERVDLDLEQLALARAGPRPGGRSLLYGHGSRPVALAEFPTRRARR